MQLYLNSRRPFKHDPRDKIMHWSENAWRKQKCITSKVKKCLAVQKEAGDRPSQLKAERLVNMAERMARRSRTTVEREAEKIFQNNPEDEGSQIPSTASTKDTAATYYSNKNSSIDEEKEELEASDAVLAVLKEQGRLLPH